MKKSLEELFIILKEKGYKIIAPSREDNRIIFKEADSPLNITLDYTNPDLGVKEWFFLRTEAVLEYQNHLLKEVKLNETEAPDALTAIIGVRPCDSRSLLILDKVFSWDYRDDFYLERRRNSLIITLSCENLHKHCFCDKLGFELNSSEGSDLLLEKTGSDSFNLSVISEKGSKVFPAEKIRINEKKTSLGKIFDNKGIKTWLDENFESDLWQDIALKCLGCGICAFACPTCHCFDIVDEATLTHGSRRKNWDSCSFAHFTLHTSGHNPRPSQKERFRNRVMHKFKYYVDKFSETACVGCGRCRRLCPVGMDLQNILEKIEKLKGCNG